MGVTASVTIVHSSTVEADSDALLSIFPGRFQVEKYEDSGVVTLIEEQLTLMVIPTKTSRMTQTALVLEDNVIIKASERAKKYGLSVEKDEIQGYCAVRLILPSGAALVAAAVQLWKDQEARSTLVTRLLAPPESEELPALQMSSCQKVSNGESAHSIANGELEGGRRKSLSQLPPSLNTLRIQRSMSMSHIPNSRPQTPINRLHPTIRVESLNPGGGFDPVRLNTRTPIPIETELFVGKLLVIMRPKRDQDDPYWNERIFSKKKRRCVVQLQGKLKYTPQSELFAGMEIADPMNLGLMASGLCNILLKFIQNLNPNMYHSFGNKNTRPHICFPASTFFERVIVTPSGGEVPPLDGTEFDEPPESIKKRKAYKTRIDWNDTCTYSLSFHSMYLDFPTWKVVNLPCVRDMSLHTFWGNSPASVVFYEHTGLGRDHVTATNKYLVSVKMAHLGEQEVQEFDDRTSIAESSEGQLLEMDADYSSEGTEILLDPVDECGDSEDQEFFDTIQGLPPDQAELGDDAETVLSRIYLTTLREIDEVCPCFIDMLDRKGKYSTVYAFKGPTCLLFRTWETSLRFLSGREPADVVGRFSRRLSSSERRRRILGLRYGKIPNEQEARQKQKDFQELSTRYDTQFLSREAPTVDKTGAKRAGFVARALSDRHWREEWGVITNDELAFYHVDRSKPNFQMSLSSVVKVQILTVADRPLLDGYHFLSIESFGRTTYLMFASEGERDTWKDLISQRNTFPWDSRSTSNSLTNHLIEVDDPTHEFLHKSSLWECQQRRILNCRKFSFRTPKYEQKPDSLVLVKTALEMATSLEPKGPNDRDLEDFLESAAALKEADARTLNETEKLVFFLNLYHVMIMHAYIVLSPPDSGAKWITYYNTISYQCSDDIFSLTELEHNIIRAKMSYPSQFISRFILPKSTFEFALKRQDFRINFALNCGSISSPIGSVPVYESVHIEKQLDEATRVFLNRTVEVTSSRLTDIVISLPKVCQWFNEDFGDGSNSDILVCIEPYLAGRKKTLIKTLWNEKKQYFDVRIWNLRFLPYSFKCRFLSLQD